ncbi:TPA: hypothetical protein ACNFPD_000604 [Enterobacter cancerogenus]|uniref:hypothetical protein n=1 Tax=Enterobacter cancerogenus TaxID=69218 RepID=UPI0001826A28|nr:hypothetical protein [Enterobacter cancerogenus]EFC56681.1 hypothetical protein ENTCAN_06549 [Enterobacter cancerogenus ATCC 35316]
MLILRLISTISKIRRSDRGTGAVHPREYPCRIAEEIETADHLKKLSAQFEER